MKIPRVMFAAVKSGSGKTTITCAFLTQLLKRGIAPVSFKCGPDYIDPMFHEQVLHIPAKNLDTFFSGKEQILELFQEEMTGKELAVTEGVMGLYDGLGGIREEGSSYHLAQALRIPIVLVVDARGMGRSILPLIAGFQLYDKEKLIKGVILNQTSKMMYDMIAPLIEKELGIAALGYFPREESLCLPDRHLGLVLPQEQKEITNILERAGEQLAKSVKLERILEIAGAAEKLPERKQKIFPEKAGETVRLAVAKDEAFCFYYKDNLRLLAENGAELVYFSPLRDKELPENSSGLLLGGGYPELYPKELSANQSMKKAISEAIKKGMPSVAECGGFLYLHENLADTEGKDWEMAGVIPGSARNTGKLVRFGYVELEEKKPMWLPAGEKIKAHEFHYYDSTENGTSCVATKPVSGRSWECIHAGKTHFWGFPHLYYPSNPSFVRYFIEAMRAYSILEH